jgi:hypothetical protein
MMDFIRGMSALQPADRPPDMTAVARALRDLAPTVLEDEPTRLDPPARLPPAVIGPANSGNVAGQPIAPQAPPPGGPAPPGPSKPIALPSAESGAAALEGAREETFVDIFAGPTGVNKDSAAPADRAGRKTSATGSTQKRRGIDPRAAIGVAVLAAGSAVGAYFILLPPDRPVTDPAVVSGESAPAATEQPVGDEESGPSTDDIQSSKPDESASTTPAPNIATSTGDAGIDAFVDALREAVGARLTDNLEIRIAASGLVVANRAGDAQTVYLTAVHRTAAGGVAAYSQPVVPVEIAPNLPPVLRAFQAGMRLEASQEYVVAYDDLALVPARGFAVIVFSVEHNLDPVGCNTLDNGVSNPMDLDEQFQKALLECASSTAVMTNVAISPPASIQAGTE